MKTRVTDLLLYRWRYQIGYVLVTLLVVVIVGMIATLIPGGLRAGEEQSAIASGTLSLKSLEPAMVINWPYHVLQRGSFLLFGVTQFSIKLPSLLIGTLTAIGIFILIKAWFRRNIAIIATIFAVTSPVFLFMIQDGTPLIMFTALVIWLFVAGTFVTRGHIFGTFWKVLGCVLLAMSLYTPLGIYICIALLVTASLHPHIRYVIRRITKLRLILAIVLGLVSIMPLVYAIYIDPSVANILLGIPEHAVDLGANLVTVGQNLFGFFATSNSYLLRPIFSLATTLLIIIGIYKLLTVKYTARSYAVLILGTIISIIVVINPIYVHDLFPLAVLMVAMGIASLIVDWYKLFPRNPYARIAGLVPLAILVAGLAFSGITRYTNNYLYNPNVLASYSFDLKILKQTLDTNEKDTPAFQLVTSKEERAFYALVAHYDSRVHVADTLTTEPRTALVTHAAHSSKLPSNWQLAQIITSKKSTESDRFYLYKIYETPSQ